jgi:cell growth-regulating nucleolar protein
MVYFQCEICSETLKKKQTETHHFRCRNAHYSCLTCFANFDRDTIKQHTACISEDEKYKKADAFKQFKNGNNNSNGIKQNTNFKNGAKDNKTSKEEENNTKENLNNGNGKLNIIDPKEIEELPWKGFRKNTFQLMKKLNIDKIKLKELQRYLMKIYCKTLKQKEDVIDLEEFKKNLIEKLKDDERFLIKSKSLN